MIRKLKRIEPLQLGKILGVLYGLLSLLFVPFFLIFPILAAFASESGTNPPKLFSILVTLAFAIFLPLAYAVMGFVLGALGAWLYNLVAKWLGGIEFQIE